MTRLDRIRCAAVRLRNEGENALSVFGVERYKERKFRPVSLPNGLAGTALPRFWQVGEGEALLLMQIYLYDSAAENQHAGLQ